MDPRFQSLKESFSFIFKGFKDLIIIHDCYPYIIYNTSYWTLQIWNYEKHKLEVELCHNSPIIYLFSTISKIISYSKDRFLHIWDIQSFEKLQQIKFTKYHLYGYPKKIYLTENEQNLITLSKNQILSIINIKENKNRHQCRDKVRKFQIFRYTYCIIQKCDHTVYIVDLDSYEIIYELNLSDKAKIIIFNDSIWIGGSITQELMISQSRECSTKYYNEIHWLKKVTEQYCLALDNDNLQIWDLQSLILIFSSNFRNPSYFHYSSYFRHPSYIPNLLFFTNDYLVLNLECKIEVIIIKSLDKKRLAGHTEEIIDIKLTQDSKYLISSSKDNTIKVWSLLSFQLIYSIDIYNPQHLFLTRDMANIIYSANPGSLNIFNLNSLSTSIIISGHSCKLNWATFSENSKYLCSFDQANTLMIWDSNSQRQLGVFSKYKGLKWIFYTPDNKYVIGYVLSKLLIISIEKMQEIAYTHKKHKKEVKNIEIWKEMYIFNYDSFDSKEDWKCGFIFHPLIERRVLEWMLEQNAYIITKENILVWNTKKKWFKRELDFIGKFSSDSIFHEKRLKDMITEMCISDNYIIIPHRDYYITIHAYKTLSTILLFSIDSLPLSMSINSLTKTLYIIAKQNIYSWKIPTKFDRAIPLDYFISIDSSFIYTQQNYFIYTEISKSSKKQSIFITNLNNHSTREITVQGYWFKLLEFNEISNIMICYGDDYIFCINTLTGFSKIIFVKQINFIEMTNCYKNIVYTCGNQDKCIYILEFNTLNEVRIINTLNWPQRVFANYFSDYLYYLNDRILYFYKINDPEYISQRDNNSDILDAKFNENSTFFIMSTWGFIKIFSFPEWLLFKKISVSYFDCIFISSNNDFIGIDRGNKRFLLMNIYSKNKPSIIGLPVDNSLQVYASINKEIIFIKKNSLEIFKIPTVSQISRKFYLLLIYRKKVRFR